MQLQAGAAFANITPETPHFLHGYPYVERVSEGVNDWLLSSALYITGGAEEVILISNDLLFVGKATVANIRKKISQATGVSEANILIAATHTHSGPVAVDMAISENDSVVPKADSGYLSYLENQVADAAYRAYKNAAPAQIAFTTADGTEIGTNRRDPAGPADLETPLMIVKNLAGEYIACLMVCSMHPTVLHEDSKLYSGDFPAFAREILQKKYLGCECPVLHFTGAAGNQSPRHVTRENSVEEAKRIGGILAGAANESIKRGLDFYSGLKVACRSSFVDLPRRKFPSVEWAEENRNKILARYNRLKENSNDAREIRTAEVDWFGAEELLYLSQKAASNSLDKFYRASLPAEIQAIRIGEWTFAAWPGEIFVEYALELKEKHKNTYLITLANGELQGYIVTREAEKNSYYEASNSLFDYSGGEVLLSETDNLLNSM